MKTLEKVSTEYQVRWMVRSDIPVVSEIEKRCFDAPWSEKELLEKIQSPSITGLVACNFHGQVAGFAVYEVHRRCIHLLTIATHPDWRRMGVGRTLLANIKGLLHHIRCAAICHVSERDVESHLFLSRHGFRATEIVKNYFVDSNEDVYRFVLKHRNA